MSTQVTVPSEHMQELRPKINALSKSNVNWTIQPSNGEMIATFNDSNQAMEAFKLVDSAVAERKRDRRRKFLDEDKPTAKANHGRESSIGSEST